MDYFGVFKHIIDISTIFIINIGNTYIFLYLLVMSRTRLRVNPHSIVAWMSRNSLLEAGAKSEGEVTTNTKWFWVRLRTKWFWVRVQLQSRTFFLTSYVKHIFRGITDNNAWQILINSAGLWNSIRWFTFWKLKQVIIEFFHFVLSRGSKIHSRICLKFQYFAKNLQMIFWNYMSVPHWNMSKK